MKLIKIGGGKDINIKGIAEDLSSINDNFIVILGANYYRDNLAERLGIEIKRVTSISGQSSVYTDEVGIELIKMAYAGLRSKQAVEIFQKHGLNAISLSGIDGGLIQGKRNQGVRIIENGKKKILHDLSGKPVNVNIDLLNMLIQAGYTPIISIPILDEANIAINTDNDAIIRILHSKFHFSEIYQFIEGEGIYRDYSDPSSFINELNSVQLEELTNSMKGGIRRKLNEIKKLLQVNPTRVFVGDGRVSNPIKNLIDTKATKIS